MAIDQVPMEQRDFTSLTFLGSSKHLEEVRQEIRRFHERVKTIFETGGEENDEIFRFSVALFPMRFGGKGAV